MPMFSIRKGFTVSPVRYSGVKSVGRSQPYSWKFNIEVVWCSEGVRLSKMVVTPASLRVNLLYLASCTVSRCLSSLIGNKGGTF